MNTEPTPFFSGVSREETGKEPLTESSPKTSPKMNDPLYQTLLGGRIGQGNEVADGPAAGLRSDINTLNEPVSDSIVYAK